MVGHWSLSLLIWVGGSLAENRGSRLKALPETRIPPCSAFFLAHWKFGFLPQGHSPGQHAPRRPQRSPESASPVSGPVLCAGAGPAVGSCCKPSCPLPFFTGTEAMQIISFSFYSCSFGRNLCALWQDWEYLTPNDLSGLGRVALSSDPGVPQSFLPPDMLSITETM